MLKANQKNIMQGALLLTVTSFVVKILSAIYRVPFQNLVGDEGFYVYQQVYPIYGIAMTLGVSGLPIVVSKMVAEQTDEASQKKMIYELFPLYFFLSLGLFISVFSLSNILAKWMGDGQLAPVIRMATLVFLLVPYLTTFRGYFQGKLEMKPTAYSQLWEQLVRVGIILLAAAIYVMSDWTIYQMGTYAMSGAVVGGVVALGTLLYFKPTLKKVLVPSYEATLASRKHLRRFVVEGGLICGYSALLVIFQLVDSFIIKNALVAQGVYEQEAKVIKGIYDRGQPLIQVGMVIGVAMTTAFLPILMRYLAEGKKWAYNRTIELFVKTVVTVSGAASVGLMMLLPYVNGSLFGDNQQAVALTVLLGTIFLMSLVLMLQVIYQSQNRYRLPLYGLVVGLLVKVILGTGFAYLWGTVGASLSTLIGLSACLLLLLWGTDRSLKKKIINPRFMWKLLVCLGMMIVSLVCYRMLLGNLLGASSSRVLLFIQAILGVVIGGSVFLAMLLKMKLFTLREWLLIPMGSKLIRKINRIYKTTK